MRPLFRAKRAFDLRAVGLEANLGWIVTHPKSDGSHHAERNSEQDEGAYPPATRNDDDHEKRYKDELACRVRAIENAQDQTSAGDKLSVGYRSCQGGGEFRRADADDESPQDNEMPEMPHCGSGDPQIEQH